MVRTAGQCKLFPKLSILYKHIGENKWRLNSVNIHFYLSLGRRAMSSLTYSWTLLRKCCVKSKALLPLGVNNIEIDGLGSEYGNFLHSYAGLIKKIYLWPLNVI